MVLDMLAELPEMPRAIGKLRFADEHVGPHERGACRGRRGGEPTGVGWRPGSNRWGGHSEGRRPEDLAKFQLKWANLRSCFSLLGLVFALLFSWFGNYSLSLVTQGFSASALLMSGAWAFCVGNHLGIVGG